MNDVNVVIIGAGVIGLGIASKIASLNNEVYIVEKNIGRKLGSKEVVHHIDGNRKNNNIENLYLCKNQSEHILIHIEKDDIKMDYWKGKKFSKEHKNKISTGIKKHYEK